MGEVFEAKHLDLDKVVAIKTLHGAVAARTDVRARFVREGQAAARIRHPNAVDVTDVGVVDGVPFLVMEMLRGEDLQALLRRQRILSPDVIAATLLPVLSALSAAHAEGIVHRDLKPANIFLHRARDGALVPKVLDFGISKMTVEEGTALTGTSALMGTPSYISPEQLLSTRDVDPRADIYSIGVILYECATGTLPFRGDTPFVIMSAVSSGAYVSPRAVRPEIPEALEQVIVRAMSRDPAQRFASAQELAQALVPFADAATAALWGGRVSLPPGVAPTVSASASPSQAPSFPSLPPTTLSGNARTVPFESGRPRRAVWLATIGVLSVVAVVAVTLAITQRSRSAVTAAATPPASPPTVTTRAAAPQPRSAIARAAVVPPRATTPVAPVAAAAPIPPAPSPPAPAPAVTVSPAAVSPAAESTVAAAQPERGRRSRHRRHDRTESSDLLAIPVAVTPPSQSVGTNAMPVVR